LSRASPESTKINELWGEGEAGRDLSIRE